MILMTNSLTTLRCMNIDPSLRTKASPRNYPEMWPFSVKLNSVFSNTVMGTTMLPEQVGTISSSYTFIA